MTDEVVAAPQPVTRELRQNAISRTFGSLRHRNYRLLWTGNMATQAGYWMFGVAQAWTVLEMEPENQALWLAVLGFAGQIPLLLFSLPAGVLADRFDRKKLILTYQIFSASVITVFALLVTLHLAQIWHVLIVAFLFGTARAFTMPPRQSIIPLLVGKEDLTNAIALNTLAFNSMRVIGPSLAGVLIALVGTLAVYWLMVVCYVWAVLWVIQMEIPKLGGASRRISPLANLVEGLRFVWHDKAIIGLMAAVSIPTGLVLPYLTLVPLYAREILNVGSTGLGILEGTIGLGAIVAALAVAAMGNLRHKGRFMLAAILLNSVAVVLFAQSTFFPLSLALLALAGIGWAMLNASNSALLQAETPDEYRGRVFSVYGLTFGWQPLGNLAIGGLAEALGAPMAIAIGGGLSIALTLALTMAVPRMRQLD